MQQSLLLVVDAHPLHSLHRNTLCTLVFHFKSNTSGKNAILASVQSMLDINCDFLELLVLFFLQN